MYTVKEKAQKCALPQYIEDILCNNYCPYFLNMSMVRENDEYRFNYRPERYRKLDFTKLNTYLKLVLLRSLIILNERNENWLIPADNYLIEPELIYSINNNVEDGSVRLLFYPDYNKIGFTEKIVRFAEKIRNKRDRNEVELFDKFKDVAILEDWNRTKIFLDKNILRIETGWN